ncbi:excalibur calcium-binding domain-containing protein [Streptomyces sp. PLK6-54]|uniref:Excalibur calcium-binding domain-containing protein n=2 Tax=Actinacidiphila acidipaludis TaxID=2873382 RepID=A0ABS7QEJ7_9ACTN|nr:excalibur calcium-binding domain-containing protein [Streptomyces acidipaludis]
MSLGSDKGYRASLDTNGDGIACSKIVSESFGGNSDSSSKVAASTPHPSPTHRAVSGSGGTSGGTSGGSSGGSGGTSSGGSSGGGVYYANCSEARAAGAAPLYAGQPGYSAHLDRDGDGVACE